MVSKVRHSEPPVTRSDMKQAAKAIYDQLKKDLLEEVKTLVISELQKDVVGLFKDHELTGIKTATKSLEVGLDAKVGEMQGRVVMHLSKSLENQVTKHIATLVQPYYDSLTNEVSSVAKEADERMQALKKSFEARTDIISKAFEEKFDQRAENLNRAYEAKSEHMMKTYETLQATGIEHIKSVLSSLPAPHITLNTPEIKPPEMTVNFPELRPVFNLEGMKPSNVIVNVPELRMPQHVINLPNQLPAEVVIHIPEYKQPDIIVNVPEAHQTIQVQVPQPQLLEKTFEYDQYNRPSRVLEKAIGTGDK